MYIDTDWHQKDSHGAIGGTLMPEPKLTHKYPHERCAGSEKRVRRTALLAAALVALLLGALVSGAGEVRAQAVSYNLSTTSAVVPGGTLTISVTTLGVVIASATAPCPVTSTTAGPVPTS